MLALTVHRKFAITIHTYTHLARCLDQWPRKQRLEASGVDAAKSIHALGIAAGLPQKGLADLIGTTPSVISRLEDAEYQGHSVAMLRRIVAALNEGVEIRFVPALTTQAVSEQCHRAPRNRPP